MNRAADGTLSGYAWSETAGWINFAATGGGVSIDPDSGNLSGDAWGENVGWVRFFGSPYQVALAKRALGVVVFYGLGNVGGGGDYPPFAPVTLSATPEAGYALVAWSPSPCDSAFSMPDADLHCGAIFFPDADGDGIADAIDQCVGDGDTIDVDADGIPDCIDPLIDSDGDGIADNVDLYPDNRLLPMEALPSRGGWRAILR